MWPFKKKMQEGEIRALALISVIAEILYYKQIKRQKLTNKQQIAMIEQVISNFIKELSIKIEKK